MSEQHWGPFKDQCCSNLPRLENVICVCQTRRLLKDRDLLLCVLDCQLLAQGLAQSRGLVNVEWRQGEKGLGSKFPVGVWELRNKWGFSNVKINSKTETSCRLRKWDSLVHKKGTGQTVRARPHSVLTWRHPARHWQSSDLKKAWVPLRQLKPAQSDCHNWWIFPIFPSFWLGPAEKDDGSQSWKTP